jgi:chromosome segregation ATPase
MATLEDAADDLVIKLRSLDSEIEESEQQLADLRARIQHVEEEVQREWTAFEAALSAFIERVEGQETRLDQAASSILEETTEALAAIRPQHVELRDMLNAGQAQLAGLTAQVAAREPELASLADADGLQPAQALQQFVSRQAAATEKAAGSVQRFLEDTVSAELVQDAQDVRAEIQYIMDWMTEQAAAALQSAFDEWEGKADELEDLVAAQAFFASHTHARDALAKVLDACGDRSGDHLDDYVQGAALAAQTVRELATATETAGESLKAAAAALVNELDDAVGTAEIMVGVLDHLLFEVAPYLA